MEKQNREIRERMQKANLAHWQVADVVGIGETTLCRWLRHKLTAEQEKRIMDAIDEIEGRTENA